jgi:hypothetical protein
MPTKRTSRATIAMHCGATAPLLPELPRSRENRGAEARLVEPPTARRDGHSGRVAVLIERDTTVSLNRSAGACSYVAPGLIVAVAPIAARW